MVSPVDSGEDDNDEDFVMFSESEEEGMAEGEVQEEGEISKGDEHEHQRPNTSGAASSRSKVVKAHGSSPPLAGDRKGGVKFYTDPVSRGKYFQEYLEDAELRHLMEDSDEGSSVDLPKRAQKRKNGKENSLKPRVSGGNQKKIGNEDLLEDNLDYIEDKEELSINVSTSSESSSSEEDNEAWLSTLQKSLKKTGLKKNSGVSESRKAANSLAQRGEILRTDSNVRDKDVGEGPDAIVAPKSSGEEGKSQPLVHERSKMQGRRRERERNNQVPPSQSEYHVCKLTQAAKSRKKKVEDDYTRPMLQGGLCLDTLAPTLSGKVHASRLDRKRTKTNGMCFIPPDNERSKLLAERLRDRRMLREQKNMHKTEVSDARRIAMQYTVIDGLQSSGREKSTKFGKDLGPTFSSIPLDQEAIAEKKYEEIRQKEEAKLKARLIEIERRARKTRKEMGQRRERKVGERRSRSGSLNKSLAFSRSGSVETSRKAHQRPRRICHTPSETPNTGSSEYGTEDMICNPLSASKLQSSIEKKRNARRSTVESIASKNSQRVGDEKKCANQPHTKHKTSQDRKKREHGELRSHTGRCPRGPTPHIAVDGCISAEIDQEQYSIEELAMAIQTVYSLGGP